MRGPSRLLPPISPCPVLVWACVCAGFWCVLIWALIS